MKRTMVRGAIRALLAVAVIAGNAGASAAAQPGTARQNRSAPVQAAGQPAIDFDKVQISVEPVRDNVFMLVGAGGNITLQVGEDGVLIVDTQFAPLSDKILAEIRKISKEPLRYIIDTHVHGDHTGGNANLAKAGTAFSGGNAGGALAAARGRPEDERDATAATILAHENVLLRMEKQVGKTALPPEAIPNVTYISAYKDLYLNGEAIRLFHEPTAHTDGDTMVHFRGSDVLSTGDVYSTETYPVIDKALGGSIQGVIDALNNILEITVPKDREEGGTMVIPGHGRLSDEADVVEYRDMVTIIRDRIKDMVSKGMTLEQVKAAKPTIDYDPRFGATTGFWTTAQFIEVVYNDLKAGT